MMMMMMIDDDDDNNNNNNDDDDNNNKKKKEREREKRERREKEERKKRTSTMKGSLECINRMSTNQSNKTRNAHSETGRVVCVELQHRIRRATGSCRAC